MIVKFWKETGTTRTMPQSWFRPYGNGESVRVEDQLFSGISVRAQEPTLPIIVKDAELIGLSTDYIINDKLELPNKGGRRES